MVTVLSTRGNCSKAAREALLHLNCQNINYFEEYKLKMHLNTSNSGMSLFGISSVSQVNSFLLIRSYSISVHSTCWNSVPIYFNGVAGNRFFSPTAAKLDSQWINAVILSRLPRTLGVSGSERSGGRAWMLG